MDAVCAVSLDKFEFVCPVGQVIREISQTYAGSERHWWFWHLLTSLMLFAGLGAQGELGAQNPQFGPGRTPALPGP